MTQQLAEGIGRVRDYIDTHGWCQDQYQDEAGHACLSGAIHMAFCVELFSGMEPSSEPGQVWKFLTDAAQRDTGNDRLPLYQYNDRVLTCQQEVLDFLDKARIAAEEKVS